MASSLAKVQSLFRACRDRILPSGAAISRIAVVDMLAHNWHLGLTCFGGPTVHFQIFRKLFVDKYQWIDETTYQEMFALCQAFNGPASTKMFFGINVMRYGLWVGMLAFFVWSLPMAIAATGLAFGVARVGDRLPDPVYALLSGLNSATVGIIALAAVQLSQKAITDKLTRILVFLGGAAGMLYTALWYFPVLIFLGGLTTAVWDAKLLQKLFRIESRRAATISRQQPDEPAASPTMIQSSEGSSAVLYAPGTHPEGEVRQFPATGRTTRSISSWKIAICIIAGFFAVFATVMVCRGVWGGQSLPFDLFANLLLAGTIIFGGGPVVVPLLREYIVSPGWVSSRDFLIGIRCHTILSGSQLQHRRLPGCPHPPKLVIPSLVGCIHWFCGNLPAWPLAVRRLHGLMVDHAEIADRQIVSTWHACECRWSGVHSGISFIQDWVSRQRSSAGKQLG